MKLPQDHPKVQSLVQQMYAQRDNVGKISSPIGYMNMQHLINELRERGWIACLSNDQETIYLEPVQEKK